MCGMMTIMMMMVIIRMMMVIIEMMMMKINFLSGTMVVKNGRPKKKKEKKN